MIRTLATADPAYVHHDVYRALDDLVSKLEVDLGSRVTSAGRDRMSALEHDVLVPLLEGLQRHIAAATRSPPSRAWLPALHAADEDLAGAERALAHP